MYFTGRSLEATRTQTALAEQGQLTDRFTKAVDQLDRAGADHLQARLGGIYALERLARDSPRDHSTILEVLTAFIRTTAHRPAAATGSTAADCPSRVAPDIQAALTVVGRRDTSHDQASHDPNPYDEGQTPLIDLRNTCLRYADLGPAVLSGALLSGADLEGAFFEGAFLDGAFLVGANLEGAHLGGANLQNATLRDANLQGANTLRGGEDAEGAFSMMPANLEGANLQNANLQNANLPLAKLKNASLESAILRGAILRGADLCGANLTGADLRSANLRSASHDDHTVVIDARTDDLTQGTWW